LRPRRRFNIEKPASDFSELIPELQVIADRIKEVKGNACTVGIHLLVGFREVLLGINNRHFVAVKMKFMAF
jgi:hypothetical protein